MDCRQPRKQADGQSEFFTLCPERTQYRLIIETPVGITSVCLFHTSILLSSVFTLSRLRRGAEANGLGRFGIKKKKFSDNGHDGSNRSLNSVVLVFCRVLFRTFSYGKQTIKSYPPSVGTESNGFTNFF